VPSLPEEYKKAVVFVRGDDEKVSLDKDAHTRPPSLKTSSASSSQVGERKRKCEEEVWPPPSQVDIAMLERSPYRGVVPPRYTRLKAHRPEGLDTGGARSSVVESDDYPVGSLFIAQQADGYDHVVIKTQPTAKGKKKGSIPNGYEVKILENPIWDSVKIQWPSFDYPSIGGGECLRGFVKMRNLTKKPYSPEMSLEHEKVEVRLEGVWSEALAHESEEVVSPAKSD
jgi:hypothetical protein